MPLSDDLIAALFAALLFALAIVVVAKQSLFLGFCQFIFKSTVLINIRNLFLTDNLKYQKGTSKIRSFLQAINAY